jgi:hypothetical protein
MYGITLDQYNDLLAKQGGGCAICGIDVEGEKKLSVDHDHDCCPGSKSCGKCIRGLLCGSCNRAVGLMEDNPDLLIAAAKYLKRK